MAEKTLWAALLAAQSEVGVLVKDAQAGGMYEYVKGETVITKGKEVLTKHGLLLTLAGEQSHEVSGHPFIRTEWVLVHPASGETHAMSRDWPMGAGGNQKGAKAAAVTNTSGLAYTIRDLLQIPRRAEDDMDHPANDARPAAPAGSPPNPEVTDLAVKCRGGLDLIPDEWKSEKGGTKAQLETVVANAESKGDTAMLTKIKAVIDEAVRKAVPF